MFVLPPPALYLHYTSFTMNHVPRNHYVALIQQNLFVRPQRSIIIRGCCAAVYQKSWASHVRFIKDFRDKWEFIRLSKVARSSGLMPNQSLPHWGRGTAGGGGWGLHDNSTTIQSSNLQQYSPYYTHFGDTCSITSDLRTSPTANAVPPPQRGGPRFHRCVNPYKTLFMKRTWSISVKSPELISLQNTVSHVFLTLLSTIYPWQTLNSWL